MTSRIKAVAAALALSSIALIPGTADAATPGVWVNNGTCANVQTNIIDNDSSTLYARIALSTGTRLRDLSFKIRRSGVALNLKLSARQLDTCAVDVIQVKIDGFLPNTLLDSYTLEVNKNGVFYASNSFNLIQ